MSFHVSSDHLQDHGSEIVYVGPPFFIFFHFSQDPKKFKGAEAALRTAFEICFRALTADVLELSQPFVQSSLEFGTGVLRILLDDLMKYTRDAPLFWISLRKT